MTDYNAMLNKMKENLDRVKNARIRAEARLEQLNKQKQELVKEIEALGVKPESLEEEIARLRREIEEHVKRAGELLPDNLISSLKNQ